MGGLFEGAQRIRRRRRTPLAHWWTATARSQTRRPTHMDPIAQFKEGAKQGWSIFAPLEMITGSVAPRLVKYAGVERGREVLDVGCGTGVVALTAARFGAKVTGVDLTPELLVRARENGAIMGLDIAWQEGDAEALPFADAKFDI